MTAWIFGAIITAALLFFVVVLVKLWVDRLAHRRMTKVVDLGKESSASPVRLEVELSLAFAPARLRWLAWPGRSRPPLHPARETARYHRLLIR
jgi:hypothetical protein